MTHATPDPENRHDTLIVMTSRSGRGTARQTIRIDEELWARFEETATAAGEQRSALVREFIRWYIREHGAKLPKRPD